MQNPRILILTISHGAAHERVANALRKALRQLEPSLTVEIIDALKHCAPWFRLYYDSYEVPLKYWPALWGWIENLQHGSTATGPRWLYRMGGQPLFHWIRDFDPDIVIATEVGTCELAAMLKRESHGCFRLVGATAGVDVDRAWAQPEVHLYPIMPGDVAAQLEAAGVGRDRILPCGLPLDPAFGSLPDQATARRQLGLESDSPIVLVLFGGTGYGRPRRMLAELMKVAQPFRAVFIAGKSRRLEQQLRRELSGQPRHRILGWVDNMHEWMAAADLLLSKPGGTTVVEAINSGLPLLAFAPLPGAERRACELIEKWEVGYWIRKPEDLSLTITRLLARPAELEKLRQSALKLARPRAADDAAKAILGLLS